MLCAPYTCCCREYIYMHISMYYINGYVRTGVCMVINIYIYNYIDTHKYILHIWVCMYRCVIMNVYIYDTLSLCFIVLSMVLLCVYLGYFFCTTCTITTNGLLLRYTPLRLSRIHLKECSSTFDGFFGSSVYGVVSLSDLIASIKPGQ